MNREDFVEDSISVSLKKEENIKQKIWPLFLTIGVIICDQLTKGLIVKNIKIYNVGASFFDGFLQIVHVSNNAVAFSVGENLPDLARKILFGIIPLLVLVGIIIAYFRSDEFTRFQQWTLCGVIGGGLGNLIDRFFRPEGVIDWIDFRFFGIFGWERFPTFNVADSVIVVCGCLLIISFFKMISNEKKNEKKKF